MKSIYNDNDLRKFQKKKIHFPNNHYKYFDRMLQMILALGPFFVFKTPKFFSNVQYAKMKILTKSLTLRYMPREYSSTRKNRQQKSKQNRHILGLNILGMLY